MSKLEAALASRYSHLPMRDLVHSVCKHFLDSGLGDDNAEQRLCSNIDTIYWQQLSEVLLAHQLLAKNITPIHRKAGPDFLIRNGEQNVWIEVICPEARGLSPSWLRPISGQAGDFPHEALLLRWTAAIKEKSEKLLGGDSCRGYLSEGIVGGSDAYVIAINGRLLRGFNGVFPELNGISQFPFAVEAAFCVGPIEVRLDRETLAIVAQGYKHRQFVRKPSGANVPTDTFFDPRFASVSAIWAMDIDESILLGQHGEQAVVHNPSAANRVPAGLLPAHSDYVATEYTEYYRIDRLKRDSI